MQTFASNRSDANQAIHANRDLLDSFRRTMHDYFVRCEGGKDHKRRPSIDLRIPLKGETPGLLCVSPRWLKSTGVTRIMTDGSIRAEVLVEEYGVTDLWRLKSRHRPTEVAIQLDPGPSGRITSWGLTSNEGMARLVEIVRDLQDDPEGVLASDVHCGHCRMCGRKLTDGHSMLRGYGPECSKKAAYLIELFQRVEVRN
jgi:hypothetical protein